MYWQLYTPNAQEAESVAKLQIDNIPTVFQEEASCTRVTVLKINTATTPGYPP